MCTVTRSEACCLSHAPTQGYKTGLKGIVLHPETLFAVSDFKISYSHKYFRKRKETVPVIIDNRTIDLKMKVDNNGRDPGWKYWDSVLWSREIPICF